MSDPKAKKGGKPRTQAERSSRSRNLICVATLDALVEFGGDMVSTNLVAKRAKLSRGALTHQFPTRNDMYVAAYQYLVEGWRNGFPFNTGPNYARLTIDELVDALWDLIYEPRRYSASMELMLAAAKDNELGRQLRDVMDSWVQERDAAAMQILGIDPDDRDAVDFFQLNLSSLRGIALLHALSADMATAKRHLAQWKQLARAVMDSHPRNHTTAGASAAPLHAFWHPTAQSSKVSPIDS